MKFVLTILICLLPLISPCETPEKNGGSESGVVSVEPESGEIEPGTVLTFTFPSAMIKPELIDLPNQPVPIIGEPEIEGEYLWKSQTEGSFKVKRLKAGATYHFKVAPGLRDLAGNAISAGDWTAEFTTPQFTVTSDFEERSQLSSQPQLALESTYKVRLTDVVEHTHFQDRDSREQYPADVIQTETGESSTDAREFRVTPRDSLPVGRTYDVVVDGLLDADSRQPLPYPRVFPAGKTVPLKIEWLGGFNLPLEEPAIKIKFNDEIDPSEANAGTIRVEPAINNLEMLASGQVVTLKGSLDLTQHYRVTVSPELKGQRGYGLAQESKWGATFRPKGPCVIFPSSRLFLRSLDKLHFSLLQINTGSLEWKLARIPPEKIGPVTARLTEFEQQRLDPLTGEPVVDTQTGFALPRPTELLIDAFRLPVVSCGTLEAAEKDAERLREIECESSDNKPFSGAYLLEVNAMLPDKRIVGNRSLVFVSDTILSQKRTAETVFVRASGMSDAKPAAGISIHAVTDENVELGRATTDDNGLASFPRKDLFPPRQPHAALFIADSSTGPAIRPVDMDAAYSSGDEVTASPQQRRAAIITDRNLYRPGQTVKIKGIMRDAGTTGLAIPREAEVAWQVTQGDEKRVAREGIATLSPDGTWESSWDIPDKVSTGRYEVRCKLRSQAYSGVADFDVQEYRVPLFSVIVSAENEAGSLAHVRVASAYFHGAPNARAHLHWKATWTVSAEIRNESFKCYNFYPEIGPRLDPDSLPTKTVEGDTELDGQGIALVECESPFKDDPAVGLCDVSWRAEVTSVDGQTLVGGAETTIPSSPTRLAVRATEDLVHPEAVQVRIDAFDQNAQNVTDIGLHAELFLVVTKTVKEQVAPFVYRYRNTDQFTKVASQDSKGPGALRFEVKRTGRYVVAVNAPGVRTPLVSDETTVTGEEPAELSVENEVSFQLEHRPEPFAPGETAVFTTKSPFPGVAWVSIEADTILDTFLVSIPGNAGRIEIPVKKEYAPNAFVSVYLTRPGGERGLPLERFAYTQIAVQRSDWKLKIEPQLPSQRVRPGDTIHGSIRVTSEGKPAPETDLAVFVVDDAVLQLGGWQLPDLVASFYYQRAFGVKSYESLNSYQETIAPRNLTHKGFIIGDGGEERIGNITNVRKEFRTLAFWAGALKTDSNGNAFFDFVAPDNLTTYRVVALGETRDNRFGGNGGTTFKISKPVLVEAALPRFLRDGDAVELRAVVHQNFANAGLLRVHCSTSESLVRDDSEEPAETVARDVPAVFRFKAKVKDPDLKPATIRFDVRDATDPAMNDSLELTIPVQTATVRRIESVAGTLQDDRFDAQAVMPDTWRQGRGTVDVILSTSPWLPEIAGLPAILEYPHGCFEQISTRLLGYALLGDLLAFLPDAESRKQEYRQVIEGGLRQIDDSILDNGMLPYWPGGTTGHPFVTAEALWAVKEAGSAGFAPPETIEERLRGALSKIVHRQIPASRFDQVFALFALGQFSDSQDFTADAEELYLRRNEIDDEGRALLALSLHRLGILPKEESQLLREIDVPVRTRAFDPSTFTSTTRAEAIRALALSTTASAAWTPDKQKNLRDRISTLMKSSASLSTQENLWLLLAFKSMLDKSAPAPLEISDARAVSSSNERSVAWLNSQLPDFQIPEISGQRNLSYLMRAKYSLQSPVTDRVDRGIRLERVVRDLTDAKRTGTAEAPFRLGDQILVTYRVNTQKTQDYVALEDLLPAGLETVNPDLAMIAKFFDMPSKNADEHPLDLSHSELRDQSTLLYFDEISAGPGQYSVLARATAVGSFRWPATQVAPMYDNRFSGLTPSTLCIVSEE